MVLTCLCQIVRDGLYLLYQSAFWRRMLKGRCHYGMHTHYAAYGPFKVKPLLTMKKVGILNCLHFPNDINIELD